MTPSPHSHTGPEQACRVCSTKFCRDCGGEHLGVCTSCGQKILIVLLVAAVVTFYTAWFGVL
jgi:hypothetical protein